VRPTPRSRARATFALLALALTLSGPRATRASCGAENCPLDLRAAHGAGPLSLALAWQYVRQDHVLVGRKAAVVGELPSPEDEVSTVSRVVSAAVHAELAKSFRLEATVPFVDRSHEHLANEEDEPPRRMAWDFSGLGDVQLMGVWRASPRGSRTTLSLQGGVKLPTGRRQVDAVDGEQPEPSARPGTGSWDGLAGVHVMRNASLPGRGDGQVSTPVFVSVLGRLNGRGTDEYRLGNELQLSAGSSYPIGGPLTLLAQVNVRLRGRDDPGSTDALAANTGGTWVFLSPGLSLAAEGGASVYGYVQLPVYQRVNRIQIVAPWMLFTGVSFPLPR
jgi:hypothetical protein